MGCVILILAALVPAAVLMGGGFYLGSQSGNATGGFLLGALIYIPYLVFGWWLLNRQTGGSSVPKVEAPKGTPRDWVSVIAGVTLVIVSLGYFIPQMIIDNRPVPNPAPIPNNCRLALTTLGLPASTVCPQSRNEWRKFIEQQTVAFVDEVDWRGDLESALLDRLCPEMVNVSQKPRCDLDYGAFSQKWSVYQAALMKFNQQSRNVNDSTIWGMIGIVALLEVVGLWFAIPLAIEFSNGTNRQKAKIGKFSAVTALAIVLGLILMTNTKEFFFWWWFGKYPDEIGTVVDGLIVGAFMTNLLMTFIGLLTFAIGFGVSMLMGIKGRRLVRIGSIVLAVGVTVINASIGLIPGFASIWIILKTVSDNPGLTTEVALRAYFLGWIAAPGITSLIGTIITAATSLPSMYKGQKAIQDLGI